MKFLLDTCVISEAVRLTPNPGVRKWLAESSEADIYLSVLTLGEIQKGISKLSDQTRSRKLQHWLDHDVQRRFAGRILSVNDETALAWGEVVARLERKGRMIPTIDGLLADSALVHRLCLVTRNTGHFAGLDIQVLNLWDE